MAITQELGFELPREVHLMDEYLRKGYPTLGWRGDPNLYLVMSVITTQKGGQQVDPDGKTRFHRAGDKVGWCWEVMRHCETGEDERILQCQGTKLHTLIPRLIKMDPRTPGFEEVMDVVEREDAIVQKAKQTAIAEAKGEHLDHLWRLVDEHQNGRHTTRQVQGFDEQTRPQLGEVAMSIRRSHTRQSKQLKRMVIADRRSNMGTHGRGRERYLKPSSRRQLAKAE